MGHRCRRATNSVYHGYWAAVTGKGKPLSDNPALTEHKRPIEALDFNAEGTTLVSASRDATIRLWDVDTRNPRLMIEGHTEAVKALGFLEDGKTLANGGSDRTLRLWNTETQAQQLIPVEHWGGCLRFCVLSRRQKLSQLGVLVAM